MRRTHALPALFLALLATSAASAAGTVEGLVVDIRKDAIDVMDEKGKLVTLRVSEDLLAGKVQTNAYPHQFEQLAVGQEVRLCTRLVKGKEVCFEIRIEKPYVRPVGPLKKMSPPPPAPRPPRRP